MYVYVAAPSLYQQKPPIADVTLLRYELSAHILSHHLDYFHIA